MGRDRPKALTARQNREQAPGNPAEMLGGGGPALQPQEWLEGQTVRPSVHPSTPYLLISGLPCAGGCSPPACELAGFLVLGTQTQISCTCLKAWWETDM